ncbi:hypothetical protein ACF8C6_12510 [Pseudomonas sp. zbq_18]|uniref:hypothetical protein n=1 Tax=Pseudomonadota TaxID=1224 RepID=UPI00370A8852
MVSYLDLEFTEVVMRGHAPPAHDTQIAPSELHNRVSEPQRRCKLIKRLNEPEAHKVGIGSGCRYPQPPFLYS